MLVTTLVMELALVGTGVATWLSNREAADSVAEARALDLLRGVRRGMREEAELADVLADFQEPGLRYVAITGRGGEVVAAAGTPVAGAPSVAYRAGPDPVITHVGGRLRLDAPTGPPYRKRGARLVIEVEPVMASELAEAARNHLIVTITLALGLLGLALWFWRLGRRADRLEAQLARDRRLSALGEMSAVLGHEIRNPLASLKGHAQLVVERLDASARAAPSAIQVVTEAERIERLVQRVLDFARTGQVDREVVDPAALARQSVASLGPRAEHVRLVLDASAHWSLDPARMQQVLANVLDNALSASPEVTLSCRVEDEQLVYTIADRGAGFPPDALDAVFEPFRTHRIQGTGLGLAIARRIVEAHGGTISAHNAADGGALVRIVLPQEAH